ncbi:MAG TPA: DNA polymerase III subunit chi [Rhizomicrobium sp.]|jgi:DNA polymerase-3 subunit chi|nr:DNA polymerase III subunit chi [Rhizomicrobium sp.]
MSEVLFYHLEKQSLDDVLPGLVERSLAKGWRVLIRTESGERAQAVDNLLWTCGEDNFLPHAQLGDGDAKGQPVLIAMEEGNLNGADVLFLVGGTVPRAWQGETADFARIVVLFDGRDAAALSDARMAWTTARQSGHEVTYWRQSGSGRWEKQA